MDMYRAQNKIHCGSDKNAVGFGHHLKNSLALALSYFQSHDWDEGGKKCESEGGKIVAFLRIISDGPRKSGQEAVASFWSNPKIGPWRFPTWCQVLRSGQGPVTHNFHGPWAEAT